MSSTSSEREMTWLISMRYGRQDPYAVVMHLRKLHPQLLCCLATVETSTIGTTCQMPKLLDFSVEQAEFLTANSLMACTQSIFKDFSLTPYFSSFHTAALQNYLKQLHLLMQIFTATKSFQLVLADITYLKIVHAEGVSVNKNPSVLCRFH